MLAQESALLIYVYPSGHCDSADLTECTELVRSADVQILATIHAPLQTPQAKYLLGSGKIAEIAEQVALLKPDVVIVSDPLTPAQERNIERTCKCRVIDRSGLILGIFARRARTFEGQLQVELAQLRHLATRLVRGWTHLERQKGGIGLRGPGETQLEVDRRLIRDRIKLLTEKLEKIRSQRFEHRRARKKNNVPVVSLVGYTNAGKSTLFNTLTKSDVYSADQLFATLDPTWRRLQIADFNLILSDTVGFISRLPHQLIAAFRATLEEALHADLLLHVIDAADPAHREHIAAVMEVLKEIGAADIPMLEVYNKIDLLMDATPRLDVNQAGLPCRVRVSAQAGLGLDLLQGALQQLLQGEFIECDLTLPPSAAKLRAQLYAQQAILSESSDAEGNFVLHVRMLKTSYEGLKLDKGSRV